MLFVQMTIKVDPGSGKMKRSSRNGKFDLQKIYVNYANVLYYRADKDSGTILHMMDAKNIYVTETIADIEKAIAPFHLHS